MKRACFERFNGAATLVSRKAPSTRHPRPATASFNGAATLVSRKVNSTRAAQTASVGFNGAATLVSRKGALRMRHSLAGFASMGPRL